MPGGAVCLTSLTPPRRDVDKPDKPHTSICNRNTLERSCCVGLLRKVPMLSTFTTSQSKRPGLIRHAGEIALATGDRAAAEKYLREAADLNTAESWQATATP